MVTPEELAQVLEYKDGQVFWKKPISTKIKIGARAGSKRKDDYRGIRYKKKEYKEHRVVWCRCKGEWPNRDIDHINRIKDDNRSRKLKTCKPHRKYATFKRQRLLQICWKISSLHQSQQQKNSPWSVRNRGRSCPRLQ